MPYLLRILILYFETLVLRLYLLNYYFYTQISGEPSRSRALPFNLKSSPFIFPLHSPLSDSLPCFPRDFLFYTGFHSSTCSPHLSSARRADSEYFEAKASVSGAHTKTVRNLLCRSPVAVARPSSGGVAIVLPVLWMTSLWP